MHEAAALQTRQCHLICQPGEDWGGGGPQTVDNGSGRSATCRQATVEKFGRQDDPHVDDTYDCRRDATKIAALTLCASPPATRGCRTPAGVEHRELRQHDVGHP
jgi:hypothetical protein